MTAGTVACSTDARHRSGKKAVRIPTDRRGRADSSPLFGQASETVEKVFTHPEEEI
jgi:hypothetical protein